MILSSVHIFQNNPSFEANSFRDSIKSMNSDLAQYIVGPDWVQTVCIGYQQMTKRVWYEQSLWTEIHHFIEVLTGTKIQNEYFHTYCINMYWMTHLNGKGYCWTLWYHSWKNFSKKISRPQKGVQRRRKYYILILLGYQSIHDKYEPAHEIFILIAYT